ncbi:histidine kinase [Bdellovibrio bacteriovorus]|uniref:histidine kinase n=1 Tax=Bdellovibrio bacteriovorus TaxID=959 RepID=A0A150WS98_BDEBC|nr:ATP-binding protein [Bdellovibrio bacteriovorus]KYG67197.1 histidine kinase [Bdellovibrio bacteriovorus]
MSEKKSELENAFEDSAFIDFEQVEEVSRVFYEESKEVLEDLDTLILKLESNPTDSELINVLFRKVHTLKGSVGAVPGGQLLGSVAHEFEALLNRIKRDSLPVTTDCVDIFLKSSRILKVLAESLRDKREVFPEELSEAIELITRYGGFTFDASHVPTQRLVRPPPTSSEPNEEQGMWLSAAQMNEFLRISGELLVLKNFFQMMNQTVNFRVEPELFERRQTDFSQNLNKLCDQFQQQVQTVRKEKADDSFQGLHVLVRQASTELNKNVQLEVVGGEMLIDKGLGQDIYDALVHVARNSIDHGIEDQFERALAGKSSIGKLTLEISESNNVIHLFFGDDGKGLDKERILQKAIKSALVTQEESLKLTEEQIYNFIFEAGFSTKDKVTTMSGRGVGMDVVHNMVKRYNGKIRVENKIGEGAGFRMEIPVPQHIMVETALLCSWNGHRLAVPLASVAHITSCSGLQLNTVNHLRFTQFSGMTVPLMSYAEALNNKTDVPETQIRQSSALFIRVKDAVVGLVVDRIEAQTDLVVKGFGDIMQGQKGFKGISILADEKVTYVLEPEEFAAMIYQISVEEMAA